METSPTTRKVVFSFVAILLTLGFTLGLSQSKAEAITGYYVRSYMGFPTVTIRRGPSDSSAIVYNLPNGAPINIACVAKDSTGISWLQLTDGNFLAQPLSSYPPGSNVIANCTQTIVYADRTLLQASGPAVYILQSGKILWVPNEETLNTCMGGYSRVTHVSNADLSAALAAYPNGGTAACPVSYTNGTTLLAPDSPAVYVVYNAQLFWVPNPDVLVACLGGWPAVHSVSPAQMSWAHASYSYGGTYACPRVAYAENTLLQGSSAGVYLVHAGMFYGIPDPGILQCYGGWPAVHHVADSEILRLTMTYGYGGTAGCPYSVPNGTKLLAPNGTVFIVSAGRSFGMPSADVLITCYGGWNGVRVAGQGEIDAMLATYPYGGPAGCVAPPPPAAVSSREQHAIDWAKSQLGSTYWNGMCELMDEQAYGTSGRFASAVVHANYETAYGLMHAGDTNVPAGALAFFGAASANGYYGHVMISIGNGQFVSNGYTYSGHTYGAFTTTLGGISAGTYIGWAYADSNWSGR